MSQGEPKRPQGGWAVNGCLFTLLTWLLAAFVMLGFAGDCLPELGHSCPTDHERTIGLLRVGLSAVVVNALGCS